MARRGERGTGDREGSACETPPGWGSRCPPRSPPLRPQEPGEGGKAKDFLGLGLKDGHLVFR